MNDLDDVFNAAYREFEERITGIEKDAGVITLNDGRKAQVTLRIEVIEEVKT